MTPSELATELAACLCATLTPGIDDESDLCFCGVLAGEAIMADLVGECGSAGCGGMAWVRIIAAYPTTQVGQIDQSGNPCGTLLGLDIEVGVLRCAPIPEGADMQDPDDVAEVSLQAIEDMSLIRRAIQCCDALDDIDYMLSTYQPIGPEGMLIGGAWIVQVAL